MVVADSSPLYGRRFATLPRGRPRFTLDSLHCHVTPPADSPRLTRRRSASASPLRVMRAESGRHAHPRAHSSARALHLPSTPLLSLSPSHSPQTPSLSLAKPWRSSPPSTLTIEAPPHWNTTGGHRRTTPTSCTTLISSSSLGRSFPQRVLLLLHLLLQAPSKEDDPELLQASPDDLKPLPVSYSTPVSVSPPRSIPHCPRIEAKDSPRAQSPLLT